ncbi:hypothetical protein RM863_38505 [Streptomyces sp. DSM 41014]|uniref:ATP/GTP-binding protein n=1 Tax=Streptomyces hintoniae TaxID=3075521 RepID=A0ABU2UXK1_9ACTN|nr:hypothetical protein [Streptomyces sp. DSM 41014]MDT0478024.1 hypothetical protein [Streptomyces sp. DSM 41014]
MQDSLLANDLGIAWACPPATSLQRDRFGLVVAGVEITAPPPVIDYVAWYTEGFFTRGEAPTKARLVIHDVTPEVICSVKDARLTPALRRAVLPTAPDTVCFVDDTHSTVHLLLAGATRDGPMLMAVRILRALVLRALLEDGLLFFHAACFTLHGVGVAVPGRRAAGKTTLLLHCLDNLGAALVGNDKFALVQDADSGTVDALGFPIQIGIRAGSVLALGDGPLRYFLMRRWSHCFSDIEAHCDDLETRLGVRPQELAAAADSTVTPRCRLGLVIEPCVDPEAVTPRLERLNEDERRTLWTHNLLRSPAEVFPQQAALAGPPSETELRVPQVPAYRLIQPPDALPLTSRVIEDLVSRVSADG